MFISYQRIGFCERTNKQILCSISFTTAPNNETLTTCFIKHPSRIGSNDYTIKNTDESLTELMILNNRKILFLPIEVAKSFPNLLLYSVSDVPVKNIAKINFANLSKLIKLYIYSLQIETIYSDTFEDLTSLEVLILSKLNLIVLDFCFVSLT